MLPESSSLRPTRYADIIAIGFGCRFNTIVLHRPNVSVSVVRIRVVHVPIAAIRVPPCLYWWGMVSSLWDVAILVCLCICLKELYRLALISGRLMLRFISFSDSIPGVIAVIIPWRDVCCSAFWVGIPQQFKCPIRSVVCFGCSSQDVDPHHNVWLSFVSCGEVVICGLGANDINSLKYGWLTGVKAAW